MPTVPTSQDASWTQRDADAFAELMLVKTRQYGVMFYDTDLRITGWNQGAAFITGELISVDGGIRLAGGSRKPAIRTGA